MGCTVVVVVSERKWGRFRGTWGEAQCALVCWWGWLKYGSSVVFISTGADDECGFRKQEIAVVRSPLDNRIQAQFSKHGCMLMEQRLLNAYTPRALNCQWPFCVGIGDKRSEIVEMLRTAHKNNHLSPQILLERRKIYQSSSSGFL